ncbi:MAG: DUF1835 domain-containing protein, partial [Ferruginibacter sp.]|nr:DUF1835 domain-containing protein [Ferruginibacter sp.]
MIHVVFNDADAKVMQEVIGIDETLAGDVIVIKDEYEIGPIENMYVGDGKEYRRQWWADILMGGDFAKANDEVDDYKTIAELVGTMRRKEEEIIWIWAAQNSHDVCGYYWILNYMKE